MVRRRVLVCGATGFIGRNTVEALAGRGDVDLHAVHFTRPPYECPGVTWHRADLRDAAAVSGLMARLGPVDTLIQAAATTSGAKDIVTRPHIHITDNAVMNSLLLRACHDHRVGHFIFFSCSVMYPSSDRPWREEDWRMDLEIHPRYFGPAWTKLYIEQMCRFFARLGATRHTVIRHTNVYGPHDKFDLERSHVFGATVTKVMTSADGTLTVWGTGEEERDLLHVDDLVDLVLRAMERQDEPYAMFHAGAGRAVSVRDLVHRIVAASGRPLAIRHDLSQPTIRTSLALDSTRAAERLGWVPKVPLDEGIARTVAWWRAAYGDSGPPAPREPAP